ncbi:MAG: response regulator transcription factor [Alloprevotella sp.]|nr:response regulator transcription factor [Alloprevotella sp.]
MNCAIIDDEPLALDLIGSYVEKTPFLTLAGKYNSAVEALAALEKEPVDLLFCDIQMPELSGLDLAKHLPVQTQVVFITAYSEYAIESYKVNTTGYLTKPVAYADFLQAANKARNIYDTVIKTEKEGSTDDFMYVKADYKTVRVDLSDILYIEGLKDYVKIHRASTDRPLLSLSSMHQIEERLPKDRFFRVHRSYIVNMKFVDRFERGHIVVGETNIPISDSNREAVQRFVADHLLTR